jgi:hypothetical protein
MTRRQGIEFRVSFCEEPLIVTYGYSPGHQGSYYTRNGDPGDPPEPPEVDLISVKCNEVEQTLSEENCTELMDLCIEYEDNYDQAVFGRSPWMSSRS